MSSSPPDARPIGADELEPLAAIVRKLEAVLGLRVALHLYESFGMRVEAVGVVYEREVG